MVLESGGSKIVAGFVTTTLLCGFLAVAALYEIGPFGSSQTQAVVSLRQAISDGARIERLRSMSRHSSSHHHHKQGMRPLRHHSLPEGAAKEQAFEFLDSLKTSDDGITAEELQEDANIQGFSKSLEELQAVIDAAEDKALASDPDWWVGKVEKNGKIEWKTEFDYYLQGRCDEWDSDGDNVLTFDEAKTHMAEVNDNVPSDSDILEWFEDSGNIDRESPEVDLEEYCQNWLFAVRKMSVCGDWDLDHNGVITLAELNNKLRTERYDVTVLDIFKLVRKIDYNLNTEVDTSECPDFLDLMAATNFPKEEKREKHVVHTPEPPPDGAYWADVFYVYDKNGDLCVNLDEFKCVLADNSLYRDWDYFEDIYRAADWNGDGCMEYHEFAEFMNKM